MINWHNIRPIHSSLNDGFEELVCQLASREVIPHQVKFQRIGKPDAGKECYWEFADGSLYMWQAKYFTSSMNATQWTQITKSVKTAIDNHTKLSKYYVCLPLDMPDGKIDDKESMLDKWKQKVTEWQSYASSKKLSVEFEFWGSTELISRLSKKTNEGLTHFWFNKEELSNDWLTAKNTESINALGARYTKELNFDLPIAKVFDGLSRDQQFEEQIHSKYKNFLEKYRGIRIDLKDETINNRLNSLGDSIQEIRAIYEPFNFVGNEQLPLTELSAKLLISAQTAEEIEDALYELRNKKEAETGIKDYYSRPHSNDIGDINSFKASLREFNDFLGSVTCLLANNPYLLITGKAGNGKSHLLADIVEKRNEKGQHSLLLLGENFTNADMPWTQILSNQLRKNQVDEFVFLGALNAKAESERARIVVFIDAINEGNGRKVWPKRLKSFIQSFQNYPWLGLVLSIRTSFEKLIAPTDDIDTNLIVRINHNGFSGVEYAAVKRYFNHYKITQPSAPLLNPEFQNPLFLKLFCKSLSDRKLYEMPPGYGGITSVIDYFLDSVNLKLARPEELDYDEKRPLVRRAVEKLLLEMVNGSKDHVEYLQADKLINEVFYGSCGNIEPYLKRLVSEGVLNEDMHWDREGHHHDVIYFAYQRFQDHLTVSLLLDKYLDVEHPDTSFQEGKLFELVKDSSAAYANQNLIEALSIQLPERIQHELFEVAPHARLFWPVAEGFVQSLIWRKHESFGQSARDYVNEVIIQEEDLFDQFLEASISVSMRPGFYFNADRLHAYFTKFSLAERDQLWTIWLQNKYDDDENSFSSVKRLIDFAWNVEDDQHQIDDESILLGSIMLGWFFCSANRYLRDASTKALVCLLQHRVHLIPGLLEKFRSVNDPYVLERLYAAAYGAVMRTCQREKLPAVSEYIYETIFNQKEVYPHILLRDYARGIIEFTLYLKYSPNVDIEQLRPPYRSKRLPKRFPSVKTIDKKYRPKGETGNYGGESWGATAILGSMTTEYGRGTARYGDFGRYTFQRAFNDWNIDHNGLSNYAIQRIFELGYDPKVFSEFDSRQGSGRGSGHRERIGKKYQWIVFYELLARVSDQCELYDESNWDKPKKTLSYNGPWYPYIRDLDPTILVKETKAERYADQHSSHWWFNQSYAPWDKPDREWIVDRKDVPAPQDIVVVQDNQGDSWLWLEVHPEWGEEERLGEDRWNSKRKRLWYQIRSYFIRRKDFSRFSKAFSRDFHRGELPEARSMYTIFDREYYWSPAFKFFNKPYYSGKDWVNVSDRKTDRLIAEVCRTVEWYNWEEEFDCSKRSAIQYFKPTALIQKALNLEFSQREGELINSSGRILCFDPSVHNKSISGLLVRKQELMDFLEKEELVLVWSVVGEKQILGNYDSAVGQPNRLNISGPYFLEGTAVKGKLRFQEE
ncbi:hypothetical protein HDC90_005203 [Pedobacter sp. AK013]|uniref:ATP-binding protein n=1 Tax=Pedobacter sp. AK013 TaxID=2723071 RepID=UPI00160C488D|nr:ATP-binding protein [Pedobacter sp. AK013]MBB6240525.1 hypothetical protein [Pedobacter sp. AK013]